MKGDELYLRHILDAIARIEGYTSEGARCLWPIPCLKTPSSVSSRSSEKPSSGSRRRREVEDQGCRGVRSLG